MLTRRFVLGLAVLTAVVSAAAVAAQYQRWADTIRSVEARPAFPGIGEKLGEVARVRIARADGSLTVARAGTGDGWIVEEAGGYPARRAAVRELLIGLSDLETIEAKTRDPARYAKLHLSDIDRPDSRALRVVLEDPNGAAVLDALFGKRVPSLSGGTPSIYIRRAGEARTWLARGELEVRAGRLDWLPILVASIERERIARATLAAPGADPVALVWDEARKRFEIEGLPEDRQVKSRYELLRAGMVSERLILDDVRPADGLAADPALGGAEWRTTDGLALALSWAAPAEGDGDARPWALFAVEAAADAAEKARKQAAGIAGRTEGWAFRFSEGTTKRLRPTLEGLTRPKG